MQSREWGTIIILTMATGLDRATTKAALRNTQNMEKQLCFEDRRLKNTKNTLVVINFMNRMIKEHFENTQTAAYILRK